MAQVLFDNLAERLYTLFFVNRSGYVNVWPKTIRAQLNRAGDPKLKVNV